MKTTTITPLELRKEWVAALLSGEYKQTTGYLRRDFQGRQSFCCLGVLCELGVKHGIISRKEGLYGGQDKVLPTSLANFLTLGSVQGELNNDDGKFRKACLSALNDDGYSFTEIADIIENEPERLF